MKIKHSSLFNTWPKKTPQCFKILKIQSKAGLRKILYIERDLCSISIKRSQLCVSSILGNEFQSSCQNATNAFAPWTAAGSQIKRHWRQRKGSSSVSGVIHMTGKKRKKKGLQMS